jgi:hypothetical protein
MSRKTEIQVGVTVLVAIAILLWGIAWLSTLAKANIQRVWHVRFAQAGGLAEGARKGGVTITRKDRAGKEQKIRVDLGDVLSGRKKDIPLQEGDVVFVPESIW